jgi:2-methylisocitrate lyase-like PEP mutase family enzyme
MAASAADRLRALLAEPGIVAMPCCFDALSARLIERAGFPLTFMSGFAVAAARLAAPDTGLICYAEMLDQGRNICSAVSIPVIGDADTGYGNALNVKRSVEGYAQAGFACLMIEDQLAPKRCGHTRGKEVVDRDAALARIRAAVDARDEGSDILILARTDARATLGLDEAIWRARAFADLMANLVEGGDTPLLAPARLEAIGYQIAAYPLALLSAAARAMQQVLGALEAGEPPEGLLDFAQLRDLVGFDDYDAELARYRDP